MASEMDQYLSNQSDSQIFQTHELLPRMILSSPLFWFYHPFFCFVDPEPEPEGFWSFRIYVGQDVAEIELVTELSVTFVLAPCCVFCATGETTEGRFSWVKWVNPPYF
jgi:hypothetical protein